MSEKYQGLIALIVATFIGGAILPSLIRTGVSTIYPITFNFFRSGISGIICFLLIRPQWSLLIKERQLSLKVMLLLGLTLAGNILFFSLGVSKTTLIVSQLMYTILPITTGIVGFFWLKEKLPQQKILGAIVAIIGVVILVFFSRQGSQQMSLGSLNGNLLILIAVSSYTFYFILSKKFSQHYSALAITALAATGAAFIFLPLSLIQLTEQGINHISTASWLSMGITGVTNAVFGFLVQYGIKRLSTMTGAIITQLSPEFAAFSGILIYHEQLSLVLILSLILVTLGVTLSIQTESATVKDRFKSLINRLTNLSSS